MGLSLEVIAKKAGIGKTTWWEIEGGLRNLTFRTAEQMALAVGSTMMQLLLQPKEFQDEPAEENQQTMQSGIAPIRHGSLAIELPSGEAFTVASAAARTLKKSIQLVDPATRVVVGLASYGSSERG